MKVGELREMLDKLNDDVWVYVRSRGELGDPFVDLVTDDDGEEVLVIS